MLATQNHLHLDGAQLFKVHSPMQLLSCIVLRASSAGAEMILEHIMDLHVAWLTFTNPCHNLVSWVEYYNSGLNIWNLGMGQT